MKYLFPIVLVVLLFFLPAAAPCADIAEEVVREINIARTDPGQYVIYLQDWKKKYMGHRVKLSENVYLKTCEGQWAVDEAIDYMQKRLPLEPLSYSKGLSMAANRMATIQGTVGQTGHISPDGLGPADRISFYGEWSGCIGENIAYGLDDARVIVMMWIIDDGVETRGHRHTMFRQQFKYAGSAFGGHKVWRNVCVVDFAAGFDGY